MTGPREPRPARGGRILVLDGEGGAALAIVQSLGRAGYHCTLGASRTDTPAFASRWVRAALRYPDPLRHADAFTACIAEWVRGHAVDLVVPVAECTLVPLHGVRADAALAARVAMPPAHALEIALDKERLRACAAGLGVPVPANAYVTTPEDLDDDRIDAWLREGAAVVKTVRSKAWHGAVAHEFPTLVVSDREALRRAVLERLPRVPVQVQQWVPGRGIGIEVLARGGEVVLCIAHERLHELPLTGGGSSYRRTIALPPSLRRHAETLMRALDYTGVAMVEFRADASRHWLMEVNPRFWGSLPLATFAGADFPRALADLLLHGVLPPPVTPRIGVYARNVERDLQWTKLVLKRRGRFTPHELGRPLLPSLLEWGRVLGGRELWDGACLRDPLPLLRSLRQLAGRELHTVLDKARRSAVQHAARRSSLQRARRLERAGRLLFLCHGNICRSAYAVARLPSLGGGAHELRSSGFHPRAGRCTPERFQQAARRRGVELAGHRSHCVGRHDLAWADLIVLMDQRNFDALAALDHASLRKVVWLGALDGGPVEIDDPYDLDEPGVQRVLGRLDACLARLLRLPRDIA